MSLRARQLHRTADGQIAELGERLSTAGERGLSRPCLGRARLGDGTVGAVAAHITDSYHRIARFVQHVSQQGQRFLGYAAAQQVIEDGPLFLIGKYRVAQRAAQIGVGLQQPGEPEQLTLDLSQRPVVLGLRVYSRF